jgi:two-component system OmpR family response regulator
MKILIVEDDATLAAGLTKALAHAGFAVDGATNGNDAIHHVAALAPDIVVLDLGLPDMDGVELLKRLRRKHKALPILILTARGRLDDKIGALDLGADDYLAKPFEMPELLARLRVLARRISTASSSVVRIGPVTVDLAAHSLAVDGVGIPVKRREFMVLKALMENAGRIQTKEMIENKLYGYGEEIASNAVEVHVSNLRKRLPKGFIQTIRGVGYSISQDPAD